MTDPLDAEVAAVLARADDLCRRARSLSLEAREVSERVIVIVARQEREERDETAIEAATTIAGRV